MSASAGPRPGYAASLMGRDWTLLVRLPPRVLGAVLTASAEAPPVCAGLAGLATIAAARAGHPAALVREVAVAIFASDARPVGPGPADDPLLPAVVRAECSVAGHVLAQRVPTGAAEEYRCWVHRIGITALATIPDDPIGAARLRLLDEYEHALAC
jgi:hypothetical protein